MSKFYESLSELTTFFGGYAQYILPKLAEKVCVFSENPEAAVHKIAAK